jgi:hydroxyethylthiazole kinase-like uncharacterized protein yjeF
VSRGILVENSPSVVYSYAMILIVRSADIARVDQRAQEEAHIPELLLMESAGLQAWQHLKPRLQKGQRLLFVVGGGNNGGDALVVSRYAYHDGYTDQSLLLLGSTISPACHQQRMIIEEYPIKTIGPDEAAQSLIESDWVIDGIAGTGLIGPLKEALHSLVDQINDSDAKVFSIDIPSGIGDEISANALSIKADVTLTMGARKLAMYHPATRQRCGDIVVVNPSFPPAILNQVPAQAFLVETGPTLLPLDKDEYKKSRGHLGIWGGSKPYSGALRLAGRAAFAARGGLVTLVCDPEITQIVSTETPSAMVRTPADANPATYDALLAGPGWGEGRQSVLKTLLDSQRPMVIDADGIRAYATLKDHITSSAILTPHLGELQVLLDEKIEMLSPSVFLDRIRAFATNRGVTLVVKSSLTHIVDEKGEIFIIEGGNPSLGVGGSGDILAGIIGALLARGLQNTTAALQGVLIHQRAGQLAHQDLGYYDSEQLIEFVGKACCEAES